MTKKPKTTLPSEFYSIREAREGDFSFIYATWLKGLRYGNSTFEFIDQDTYFKQYGKVLEALLARPDTIICVACLADDPNVILGYSVIEAPGTLHFVFVKSAWRHFGIATSLLPPDFKRVTHVTALGRAILERKFPQVQFNPFIG